MELKPCWCGSTDIYLNRQGIVLCNDCHFMAGIDAWRCRPLTDSEKLVEVAYNSPPSARHPGANQHWEWNWKSMQLECWYSDNPVNPSAAIDAVYRAMEENDA